MLRPIRPAASEALTPFGELMTEAQVCGRFTHLVSGRELRKARQASEIAFYQGKKGMVLYHPDDLAAYFKRKQVVCSEVSAVMDLPPTPRISAPKDLSSEDEKRCADHLAEKYSRKPKPASSSR